MNLKNKKPLLFKNLKFKVVLCFILLSTVINLKPVFADNINQYQTCIDNCYSTNDLDDNIQIKNCLNYCSVLFPLGSEAWSEASKNIGSISIDGTKESANTFKPNVPIGDFKGSIPIDNQILFKYLSTWYGFVVGAIGIIATVIIMWGGFKWLTSRGNAAAIGDAKDRIWSAIIGLVLVFLSYNILSLINPKLLTIDLPTLNTVTINNIEALRQEEPQGQDMNNQTSIDTSQHVNNLTAFTGNGINISSNRVRLDGLTQETMDVAQQIQDDFGQDITITSAYRPQSTGSQHADGRAVDLARSPEFDNFMRTEVIGDAQPAFDYRGQPGYEVNYNGVNIRVIDETVNNCWHIDTKPR